MKRYNGILLFPAALADPLERHPAGGHGRLDGFRLPPSASGQKHSRLPID
ncbi:MULTISPECIES: hypothetical protein [Paenibacillus]|nr:MULTISPECIES: hypothetical protein [Paenibacillus]